MLMPQHANKTKESVVILNHSRLPPMSLRDQIHVSTMSSPHSLISAASTQILMLTKKSEIRFSGVWRSAGQLRTRSPSLQLWSLTHFFVVNAFHEAFPALHPLDYAICSKSCIFGSFVQRPTVASKVLLWITTMSVKSSLLYSWIRKVGKPRQKRRYAAVF
jgi:hypothetical protein